MKTTIKGQPWRALLLAGATVALSACASTKPPSEAVSQADLAVKQASASKAPQYAPLELTTASTELEQARQAMNAENYLEARRLAEKALVDAQLAEAKAGAEEQRRTAQQLRQSIDALKTEATRASTPK